MGTPEHILIARRDRMIAAHNDIIQANTSTEAGALSYLRRLSADLVLGLADVNGYDADGMTKGQAIKVLIKDRFGR